MSQDGLTTGAATSASKRGGGGGGTGSSSTSSKEIDSVVYGNKVRINHWHDKMMEHKKIYYAAELKMYQLELALAKWDNSNKLRWSVRHREIMNPIRHEPPVEKPKRPPPQPAFGYVPVSRKFAEGNTADCERDKDIRKRDVKESDAGSAAPDAEMNEIQNQSGPNAAADIIPVHSEDYKPFSSTPSIHSYMYHLRKIYGK